MKILIVDDSFAQRKLLAAILGGAGYTDLHYARHGSDALVQLEQTVNEHGESTVDLVIMDYRMNGMDGAEACRRMKQDSRYQDIPVIIVTAMQNDKILTEAFEAGAMDFVARPFRTVELLARIRSALTLRKELMLRKERERELRELNEVLRLANDLWHNESITDGLTGLRNHRYFEIQLVRQWWECARLNKSLCLFMLDVDYFKQYNDTLGHQEGDVCLKMVADALDTVDYGETGMLARYGGEEFVLILPDCEPEQAEAVAVKMNRAVRDKQLAHPASDVAEVVTISLGIAAAVPGPETTPEALLRNADMALYKAKEAGRDRYVFHGDPRQGASVSS